MDRTLQQIAAVEALAPRLCADAGAGAGKTRVLIDRIAHLLDRRRAGLEEIVAITFTERAAGEMKERLRREFHDKAPQSSSQEMTFWRDLERRVDTARISTIHAFCTALLKENALLLGLDPEFSVLAEAESVLLLKETVTETLYTLIERGDEAAMRLAAEMPLPGVVAALGRLARARPLVDRICEKWPFTDAAALAQRWAEQAEKEHVRRLAGLRHSQKVRSFLKQLCRFNGRCLDPEDPREVWRRTMVGAFEVVLASSDPEIVRNSLSILNAKPDGRSSKKNWDSEATFKEITDLQKRIGKFVSDYIETSPPDAEAETQSARLTCDLFKVFQVVCRAIDAAKTRLACLDFDDLIGQALRALRDQRDLRRRIARGIKFLLIDEFQDTDATQLEIARLLTGEDGGPALFIVGDAKQSIYYFRGAEVEVFQAERERATQVLPLDCNFRALPDIVEFVNDFFETSGMLSAVEEYHRMAFDRKARNEPRVEFLVTVPPDDAENPWLVAECRRAEARAIAARIAAICSDAESVEIFDTRLKAWRAPAFCDVALLFRSMSNVHLYEEALREAGIPFVLLAGAGFYTRQEILDMTSLLRVVVDPWDESALLAFLRSPMAGLSDEDLLRLARAGGLTRGFQDGAIPAGCAAPERLLAVRALVRELRNHEELPVAAFLRYALDRTGYEAILLSQFLGLQKASNVRKLVGLAEDFARSRPPALRAFVQYLEEMGSEAVREGEAGLHPESSGAVTLLTIHKAKGLEFPIVFVPDMSQGARPSRNETLLLHRDLGMALRVTSPSGKTVLPAIGKAIADRIAAEEEAEHARLLYVALTRARDFLVMSGTARPAPGSWFETLNEEYAICERGDGEVCSGKGWQAVVRRGFVAEAPRKVPAPVPETPDAETILKNIAPCSPVSVRQTFSISELLDYLAGGFDEEQERGEDEPSLLPAGSEYAPARGSLVHRLFERWDFHIETPPINEVLAEARLGLAMRNALEADLRELAARFYKSPLGRRLSGESIMYRETPFCLRLDDALITGKIDALLPDGTIIDYKTGRIDDQRNARYEWQLLLYAAAVRQLTAVIPSNGMLAYVDAHAFPEIALSEEDIAGALRHAREAINALRAGGRL